MPEAHIRTAVPPDAAPIAEALLAAFVEYRPLYTTEAFAATTPTAEQIVARMEEGPVWVATFDEVIVGTVSAVPRGESLYVRGMAVVSAARGHGIGQALFQHVERYATEQRFTRLYLSTTPFLARAIRLYEHLGFQRNDERPHHLFGTPLFTMAKTMALAV
jgi:putative acetyltransferase